jgi:hypothetical protein
MIPEKPAPDLIRGGHRFLGKDYASYDAFGRPYARRDRIIAFAAQNRLPAVYHFREYAFVGGLVSYAPSITDAYRQAGNYTVIE